jgi:hypothetical protein
VLQPEPSRWLSQATSAPNAKMIAATAKSSTTVRAPVWPVSWVCDLN